MRHTHLSRRIAIPAAVALGLGLFTASLTWHVPAVRAGSGPLDAQASEFVRLINGVRATAGKPALAVDPFLASKARDGSIPCPDDANQTLSGRAQDFAAFGQMSHDLRLCDAATYTLSSTLFVSVLESAWGYGSVGEIDLVNGGYGDGAFLYSYNGWQTWTYSTTGHGMAGWQSSSSHWNIIMGGYDRVGCGGWASGSTYYYDCAFSAGGPNGTQAPPTKSPFDDPLPTAAPPAPTAAPPAATPCRTKAPTPKPTPKPTPTPTPTPTPMPTPTATATPIPTATPDATATSGDQSGTAPGASPTAPSDRVAILQLDRGGNSPTNGLTQMPAFIALAVALISGFSSVLLSGWYLLLSLRQRRRRETAS